MLELYGAKVVFSPGSEGSNGAVRQALRLAESNSRYFMLNQYANEANPRAHYEGTGAEIAEALPRVDAFVAGLGTGGTLMGAGERLRESFPDVLVADGYLPPILDVSRLDRKILVSNDESLTGLRALLDREGIFAGVSSGAVVHVARRIASELDDDAVVVAVLADAGWKYLSADFWTEGARTMEDHLWW